MSSNGPGKSWKLKLKVLESPGIYLWFKFNNIPNAEFGLLLTCPRYSLFLR